MADGIEDELSPDEDCEDLYESLDDIDFGRLFNMFRELAFFDDTFLSMQALNICVVDQIITPVEYALLRELFETERTLTDSAIQVSALSQMWIFALYELLRNWRGRIWHLRKQLRNGMLEAYAQKTKLEGDRLRNTSAIIRSHQAFEVLRSPTILDHAELQFDALRPAFQTVELLRMNLAKHAAPGKDTFIPSAPGYGRINSQCGAMDFGVESADGSFTLVNRRDVADALRAAKIPRFAGS